MTHSIARLASTLPKRFLHCLRESLIELSGLSPGLRALAFAGYATVFGLLVSALFFELRGGRLPGVEFEMTAGGLRSVPFAVMRLCSVTLVVGWAYVLTGATQCRRRVFLPIAGVFALQLTLLSAALGNWAILLVCAAALLIGVFVGAYALTHRRPFWRDRPLVQVLFWLGVMSFFTVTAWVFGRSAREVAAALNSAFLALSLLAVAFWVLLGVEAIGASIGLARAIGVGARRLLTEEAMRALAVFTLLARPSLAVLITYLTGDGVWMFDFLFSIPLILLTVALWATGRWTTRNAHTLLALGLASTAFTLALSLAFQGHDLTELAISATGLFPPMLLFVGLTAYNVLGWGVRYANVDGEHIPRRGRVLLYFGGVILIITFVLFSLNQRVVATGRLDETEQVLINDLFALVALLLGFPYLLWVVWKRRDELIGSEAGYAAIARPALLARVPARLWIVAGILGASLFSCVACTISALSVNVNR